MFLLHSVLVTQIAFAKDYSVAPELVECAVKSIAVRHNGKRKNTAIPTSLASSTNSKITSDCIQLTGIETSMSIAGRGFEISINGSLFMAPQGQKITNNDRIRVRTGLFKSKSMSKRVKLRLKEDPKINNIKRAEFLLIWRVFVLPEEKNKDVFHVGPSHKYRQINDVLSLVAPGDTIQLEAGATYEPISIENVSGNAQAPIRLIGERKPNVKRATISGGTKKGGWTLGLKHAHYWYVDNLILKNGNVCFRIEASNVTLENTLIESCHNGILGADVNTGNIKILNSEIRNSGGKQEGRAWGHAVYIATDRDRFPNSVLRIESNFLHSNRGNSIKSRAERSEIRGNWIESSLDPQSRYLLELIGYDAYDNSESQNHIVENNVLRHIGAQHSVRTGGDGTGASNGQTRLSNNLFLFEPNFKGSIFRLYHGLESFVVERNVFAIPDTHLDDIILIRDMLKPTQWVNGKPAISFNNNVIPNFERVYQSDTVNYSQSDSYFSDISIDSEANFPGVEVKGYSPQSLLVLNSYLKSSKIDEQNKTYSQRPIESRNN